MAKVIAFCFLLSIISNMKKATNNLELLAKCPVCNKKRGQTKMLVLDEKNNQTVFHLTCDSCKTSALVFVSEEQMGVVSLGMLTDLSANEAVGLFKGRPVSSDQVIKTYELLKDLKGGVSEII